ncbi:MAG: hypothetical protein RIR97_1197 [Pseudomonadota bacterium]
MINLRFLVEKSADSDVLCEMIGFAAQRLMELEVGTATGAVHGEKNPMRMGTRHKNAKWAIIEIAVAGSGKGTECDPVEYV